MESAKTPLQQESGNSSYGAGQRWDEAPLPKNSPHSHVPWQANVGGAVQEREEKGPRTDWLIRCIGGYEYVSDYDADRCTYCCVEFSSLFGICIIGVVVGAVIVGSIFLSSHTCKM